MPEHVQVVVPFDKVSSCPSTGSMVAMKGGRIAWFWCPYTVKENRPLVASFSRDGGRTWSDPEPQRLTTGATFIVNSAPKARRLADGRLGLAVEARSETGGHYLDRYSAMTFHVSEDDGKTWSPGVPVNPTHRWARSEDGTVDSLLQLKSGRLVLPFTKHLGPAAKDGGDKWGRRFGEPFVVGWSFDLPVSFAYYSDDLGQTWQRSRNEVFATIERGMKGAYGLGEPQIAELADGRLLMIGRTALGRLFRSYSEDGGETWFEAEATDLAARIGPTSLKRIPGSDDVLVIWNQVSAFEVMSGLYRHRLSCAVSKDGGQTWGHFKNLVSLDDTTRVEADDLEWHVLAKGSQPVDRKRYHRAPGPLRNDHPLCLFHDGHAIICHSHQVLGDKAVIEQTYGLKFEEVARQHGFLRPDGSIVGNNKVHILPIEWLYV